ncbi:MAG: hypothetical protein KGJ23_05845 [Euryarchaeota archaeon]|nr:hypothetical protein [Euryarchaeota archaeon]MDE1836121.1 hypothetical protein [Euryarchaeota archaeon]MDE1879411.1 hypothetical protein [Euryarchaeota archaeon]MDE2044099.1 hypothetical protein [Thermoplasmata archaeon]
MTASAAPAAEAPSQLESLLTRLGLSPRLARSYLIVARQGPMSAPELARMAGTHRVAAYRDAKELMTRGLLTAKGSPRRFEGAPLKRALDLLEREARAQVRHLKDTRRKIERLWGAEESRPWEQAESLRFRYFEGREQVVEATRRLFGLTVKRIDAVLPPNPRHQELWTRIPLAQSAHARGVKFRTVVQLSRENLALVRKLATFTECRDVQGLYSFRYSIFDGRGILMALTEDPAGGSRGFDAAVWTTAPEALRFYRRHFEMLFSQGTPIDRSLTFYEAMPQIRPVLTRPSAGAVLASLEEVANRWLSLFRVARVRMDLTPILQSLGYQVGVALGRELPRGKLPAVVRGLDRRFARESLGHLVLSGRGGDSLVRWERCPCCSGALAQLGSEVCPAVLQGALRTAVSDRLVIRAVDSRPPSRGVHILLVRPQGATGVLSRETVGLG